jgi:GT2 family glycosyltransferase
MDISPTISVVIVSWNATDYLEECLASLFGLGLPWSTEVIVIDNASSDGSPEMVRQRFPEVVLIQNSDNLGFAKANNIGIRRCTGKYVALVNSDVHVLRNCMEQLVEHLASNRRIGMVGPRIIGGDGKHQNSYRGFPRLWNMFCRGLALDRLLPNVPLFSGYLLSYSVPESPTPVEILSGCFLVVRREALQAVGLLDEAFFIYGEDMDWCKRFWQAGWSVEFVPAAESIHYGGASSSNAPLRFFIEMQRADLQYWKKHHSRTDVALYAALSILHHLVRIVGHLLASVAITKDSRTHMHRAKCSAVCLRWMVSEIGHGRAVARR